MSRRNIFEILSDKNIDIKKEIKKIANLVEKIHIVYFTDIINSKDKNFTILEFLTRTRTFLNWKYRKTYFSIEEMMNDININILKYNKISTEQIISYLEFSINMIELFNKGYKVLKDSRYSYDKGIYHVLCENIKYLLEYLNLKVIEKDSDIFILVEKDSAAISAAEVIEDKNLSFNILEYNHYLLKGDVNKKRNILKSLADKLEVDRKKLTEMNNNLADDLFFLFNNIKIRHDNEENKKLIDKIGREKLEFWYDETYQMALLAILILDNKKRHQAVKELKTLNEKK